MKAAFRIFLMLAVLSAMLPAFTHPTVAAAAPPADDIPVDWWTQAQADIRSSEYDVTWQTQTYLADVSAAYHAANRAQNLRAYFTPNGVRIIPRTGDVTWELGLSLNSASAAELTAQDHAIGYQRDALAETFTNAEIGLEHAVTLDGATTLDLVVAGNLTPRIAADGQSVEFLTAAGVPVLRYGDFSAGQSASIQLSQPDATHLRFTFHVSRFTHPASPLTFHALLTALPTAADWSSESNQADAQLGVAVAGAGDVNGDGFADVIVGAPGYDGGANNEGRVYVYHGSAAGLSNTANWNKESDQAGARFGAAVASAGDVNNDGFSDVIVGAPNYGNGESQEGAAFVYHGAAGGLGATAAWRYESNQANAHLGAAVSSIGYADNSLYTGVIVGAPDYDNGQVDEGYVLAFYGSASGLSASPDWDAQSDQGSARFGAAVSSAGDVNGDGYYDVIIGAPDYDNNTLNQAGAAFLYLGASGDIGAVAAWSVINNQANAQFGAAVTLAGDTNGDGYGDMLVGAPGATGGENANAGAAYIYLGASANLTTTASWQTQGAAPDTRLGAAAAMAGDIDGDGYADVIVGAPGYSNGETGEGTALVFMGAGSGITTTASSWNPQLNQGGANLGAAVAGAGDVDGDGFSDVIVGAPGYSHSEINEGGAFVYYGHSDPPNQTPNWTVLRSQAGEEFGIVINSAGDVNGDGYADVIVGAPLYDGGQDEEGRAFVYYGSPNGLPTTASWIHESDRAFARFGAAVSTAGDADGDGYDEVVIGAPNDTGSLGGDGRAYVFFGQSDGLQTYYSWYVQGGKALDQMGAAVACAGDVNGDGYSDLIVGAPGHTNGQNFEGAAYIWLGTIDVRKEGAIGFPSTAHWGVESNRAGALYGQAVSTAGDVNGDGYSDVLVGTKSYNNGQSGEGAAFLFLGSAGAMSTAHVWHAEGNLQDAEYGISLSTAGDVNGDGYSDFIIGAPGYENGQNSEGAAFLYYGTPGTINPEPDLLLETNEAGAAFGTSVSGAGDVNGDGYADVIVGAPGRNLTGGGVYIFYGAATGLHPVADWSKGLNTAGVKIGAVVSAAGDVNGDGFGDVIAGTGNYSAVYAFYGNGGGLPLRPRQMQLNGVTRLAPLGRMNSRDSVQLHLEGKTPLGRDRVKFEWQVAPLGRAFGAPGTISGVSGDWTISGSTLTQTVTGLAASAAYHWRVRLHYRPGAPLGMTGGRWIHMPWNGWLESDFQTAPGALTGVTATNDSPTTIGDTTTLTGTSDSTYVTYAWDFGDGETGNGKVVTHTYEAVGHYEAQLTANNGVSTVVVTTAVAILDVPIGGLTLTNSSPTIGGHTTFFTASAAAGSGITYTWDFGDDSPPSISGTDNTVEHVYDDSGIYQATVTASNTAGSAEATAPVTITDAPIAGLTLVNSSPTPLDNATILTASVAEGTGIAYDWNFGDGEVLAAGGASVQHVYPDMGNFTAIVTATNSMNSMVASTLITITAGQPVSGLLAFNNGPTPLGNRTTLSATVEAGSGVTYTWAFGDGAFFYPQNWPDSGKVVTHTYPDVGVFTATVTARNRFGELSATTTVTIQEAPIAGLSAYNNSPTMRGAATTLSATVAGGSHVEYAWDLGDGQSASGATVEHTYPDVGVFTATVTATNPLNAATATTTITILPVRRTYLPLVLRDFVAP